MLKVSCLLLALKNAQFLGFLCCLHPKIQDCRAVCTWTCLVFPDFYAVCTVQTPREGWRCHQKTRLGRNSMQDQCMPAFSVHVWEKQEKLEPRFCDGCARKELARHWTVAHVARNLLHGDFRHLHTEHCERYGTTHENEKRRNANSFLSDLDMRRNAFFSFTNRAKSRF